MCFRLVGDTFTFQQQQRSMFNSCRFNYTKLKETVIADVGDDATADERFDCQPCKQQ